MCSSLEHQTAFIIITGGRRRRSDNSHKNGYVDVNGGPAGGDGDARKRQLKLISYNKQLVCPFTLFKSQKDKSAMDGADNDLKIITEGVVMMMMRQAKDN